jgi:hypothetical protein
MAAFQVMIHDRPEKLATSAPVELNYYWDREEEIEDTQAMVNGRCQDLLAVVRSQDQFERQGYLYRLQFLHRSVRDFLNGSKSVQTNLEQHAGQDLFDVHLTLLSCYVFLVKRVPMGRGRVRSQISSYRGISESLRYETQDWCEEAFFHLRKVPSRPSTTSLITSLDEGMQLVHTDLGRCHWSNHLVEDPKSYGAPAKLHDLDVTERGHRDLLGHLIEQGLTDHVEALIKTNPAVLRAKEGRPYLDYALRYKTGASSRSKPLEELSSAYAMVELLLQHKLDVNEKVYIHGGRTVWDSYIYFVHDNRLENERHLQIARLLINKGAQQIDHRALSSTDRQGPGTKTHDDVLELGSEDTSTISMVDMLKDLFGGEEAEIMQQSILANGQSHGWMSYLTWPRTQSRSECNARRLGFVWKYTLVSRPDVSDGPD